MKTYARPKAMFRKEKAKKDNDEDNMCSDSFEEQAYTATLCKTGMQCMPIVGVRSRRLLLDLTLGKKVNETTRARNIASDTSLIISFRDSSPVYTPKQRVTSLAINRFLF